MPPRKPKFDLEKGGQKKAVLRGKSKESKQPKRLNKGVLILGRAKRHESVQKKQRQQVKAAKRQRKRDKRVGKSSGVEQLRPTTFASIELLQREQRTDPKKAIVQLRQIGSGRIPKIRAEVLNKLKKGQSTHSGQYSYTMVQHWPERSTVRFDLGYNLDLSSPGRKHLGMFEINFERGTIARRRRE